METFMSLPLWQCWIILGLILLILELFISGFMIACFGLSALCTAIVVIFGADISIQLLTFGVLNIVFLWLLRPMVNKHLQKKEVKSCVDALIDKEIVLDQSLDVSKAYCEQKISGDVWRIRSNQGNSIEAGSLVKVVKRDGLVLYVELVQSNKAFASEEGE